MNKGKETWKTSCWLLSNRFSTLSPPFLLTLRPEPCKLSPGFCPQGTPEGAEKAGKGRRDFLFQFMVLPNTIAPAKALHPYSCIWLFRAQLLQNQLHITLGGSCTSLAAFLLWRFESQFQGAPNQRVRGTSCS